MFNNYDISYTKIHFESDAALVELVRFLKKHIPSNQANNYTGESPNNHKPELPKYSNKAKVITTFKSLRS